VSVIFVIKSLSFCATMANRDNKAKHWVFTLNNPAVVLAEFCDEKWNAAKHAYLVVGEEVGEETHTPHFQGYIAFLNKVRFTTVKALLGDKTHVEVKRGTVQEASDYCKKDGRFLEYGVLPSEQCKRGADATRDSYEDAYQLAKKQKVSEIAPMLQIRHLSNLQRIADRENVKADDLGYFPGVFIYGPPGSGKSHYVRSQFPGAYWKDWNKWWDEFPGGSPVIMEDLDPTHTKFLAGKLKIWLDRFAFRAEAKNRSFMARPSFIAITSNYSLEELFDSQPDLAAIRSRVYEIYLGGPMDRDGLPVDLPGLVMARTDRNAN